MILASPFKHESHQCHSVPHFAKVKLIYFSLFKSVSRVHRESSTFIFSVKSWSINTEPLMTIVKCVGVIFTEHSFPLIEFSTGIRTTNSSNVCVQTYLSVAPPFPTGGFSSSSFFSSFCVSSFFSSSSFFSGIFTSTFSSFFSGIFYSGFFLASYSYFLFSSLSFFSFSCYLSSF